MHLWTIMSYGCHIFGRILIHWKMGLFNMTCMVKKLCTAVQHHGQQRMHHLTLQRLQTAKVVIFLPRLELKLLQGKNIDIKVWPHLLMIETKFLKTMTPKSPVVIAYKVIPKTLVKHCKPNKNWYHFRITACS